MTGHRFVLSGIGVAYVCAAVVGYLLTRSEVDQAQVALRWMAGSLAQAEWGLVQVLAAALGDMSALGELCSQDERDAALRDAAAAMLRDLGLSEVRLLTNNPAKVEALEDLGITVVERVQIEVTPNEHNIAYLLTKQTRMGHDLNLKSAL